jgi:predicted nucleotidyltransferase
MISEATIQEAVRRLVARARHPARKVILFGSYARGDATEDSDLDFLVVESDLPDKFGEMVSLRQAVRPLGIPVDIMVCSEAELADQRDSCSSAVYWAVREGKVVHDATH